MSRKLVSEEAGSPPELRRRLPATGGVVVVRRPLCKVKSLEV